MNRLLFLLALACAVAPLRAAEATTLEERVRLLETRLAVVEKENAELRARVVSPVPVLPAYGFHGGSINPAQGTGAVVPAGTENRVSVGGFSQAQMEFGGTGDQRFVGAGDRIYMRRSRLSIIANFAEHFETRLEAEFAAGGVTPGNGLRAQGNELYLNWSRYPMANVRFGQIKPAFSTELIAIEYKGPMVERSLGAERVGDGRQIGATVFGDIVPQKLSYAVMIGNGNGTNTSANDDSRFNKTAHVTATAFDGKSAGRLLLGAGVLHSRDAAVSKPGFGFDAVPGGTVDNLFAGSRTGWGVDATWRCGLLEVASEWLRMRFSPTNRVPDAHFDGESWQLTAAYYLVPQKFQFAVRREHFDPNLSRRGDSTENWLVGFDYYIKGDDLRVIVDYLFGRAPGLPDNRGRLLTRFQIVY